MAYVLLEHNKSLRRLLCAADARCGWNRANDGHRTVLSNAWAKAFDRALIACGEDINCPMNCRQ
jgi:hypothetical protein